LIATARRLAIWHKIASAGDRLVIMAGVPFGVSGSTNVLHVVKVTGDELETYTGPAEI
jgi:pyruvate kinase